MKKINELTEREILDLTEEQIQKMIKACWVEEGVKIIKNPEEPEYHKIPQEDLIHYRVEGFSYAFSDPEEADRARDFIRGMKSLKDYTYGSDYKKIERNCSVKPNTESAGVYSSGLYETVKPLLEENSKIRGVYEIDLSEYEAEKIKQDELSVRILNRIEEVRDEYAKMERIWKLYRDEYLPLAGDEVIAMAFLKKAYAVNSKTEHYIEDNMKNAKETEATV
ncbi:MAG: hypothetical protein LBJ72_08395 [Dysgonamonadaceae bacterium]|jgi:hypothetical protein|nr:hypothetical protein [Dysgonamonadaceae bacterium]